MSEMCLDVDLHKVCRICLSQTDINELLFNIFTDAIVDGMLVALPEVIEYCVEIQVKDELEMPNQICQSCKSLMYQFYVFKQKCHRTDNLLRSLQQQTTHSTSNYGKVMEEREHEIIWDHTLNQPPVNEPDSISDYLFPNDCVEETIEEEVVAVLLASESINSVQCSSESGFTQSQEEVPENDASNVIEMHEEDYASDAYEDIFDPPVLSEQPDANSEEMKSEHIIITRLKPVGSNCHVCDICGKSTASRSRLMKHMKLHNDSNIVLDHMNFFSCASCQYVFLREEDLNEHNTTQRCISLTENGGNRCAEDGHLEPNMRKTSGGICGICDTKYGDMVRLKQHIIIHLDKFPCPLEGCGCEYASLARLSIHVSNQHVDYLSPTCPHCNESIERVDLRQHVRLFCKAKQFGCTHCDKKFLSSKALSQHLRKLEQSFPCSQCDKALTSLASLRLHERTHSGERPYVCTICNKSYKTSSLRTAHMDTHIDGKTFKCSMCDKYLQTRACYRNHLKRHLEARNHECFVCGKKFFQKCTLRVHLKMVHKISRAPGLVELAEEERNRSEWKESDAAGGGGNGGWLGSGGSIQLLVRWQPICVSPVDDCALLCAAYEDAAALLPYADCVPMLLAKEEELVAAGTSAMDDDEADAVGPMAEPLVVAGGSSVSGTRCGVRLEIGGRIGLAGHG
uniref:Protein krueppel n=1 Tax=Anopheles dirus TaxID=7168 RepID=A0A182NDD0_9DIPT